MVSNRMFRINFSVDTLQGRFSPLVGSHGASWNLLLVASVRRYTTRLLQGLTQWCVQVGDVARACTCYAHRLECSGLQIVACNDSRCKKGKPPQDEETREGVCGSGALCMSDLSSFGRVSIQRMPMLVAQGSRPNMSFANSYGHVGGGVAWEVYYGNEHILITYFARVIKLILFATVSLTVTYMYPCMKKVNINSNMHYPFALIHYKEKYNVRCSLVCNFSTFSLIARRAGAWSFNHLLLLYMWIQVQQ